MKLQKDGADNVGGFHLRSRYVHIVWCPIGVFLFAEALLGIYMQTPSLQLTALREENYLRWTEEAARLQFLGLFILFFVFSWMVIFKFWYDRAFLFDRVSRDRLALAFILCAIAGAVIILSAVKFHLLPRSFDYFDEQLFMKALASSAAYARKGSLDWTAFQHLMTIVNITAGLAVPAFIAGGISCLGVSQTGDPKECWITQRERLQTYIYLSAALLVNAVMFLKVWTQYPSFVLKQDATVAAYNAVVNSYSVFTGIEYTLLLASYALSL